MTETFENKSLRSQAEGTLQQRTQKISNCLFNDYCKSKCSIPEVEKEEESFKKKVKKLIETSTKNKKQFFCNSDFNRRVEK